RDDDPAPLVSIDDIQVREGSGKAVFTVNLSTPSGQDVHLEYETESGSAIQGEDFTSVPILITIRKAFSSATIEVPIVNDLINEANETFFVNLTRSENAVIAKGRGQATILDDDSPPEISVLNAPPVSEGAPQETNAVFTVTLSSASGQLVGVDYATSDGTAVSGKDYVTTFGTLVFNPGQTTNSVSVPIVNDFLNESQETFLLLNLSSATNGTIVLPQARATIIDDDPQPSLSINSTASVLERDSDATNAVFTVTLFPASRQKVTVKYSTDDAREEATTTVGLDYAVSAGLLTFNPGEISKTVTVPVLGDTLIEPNEVFFILLSEATNAIITNAQGLGIIVDNEPRTTISIEDASVTEGDFGTTNMVFTVRLAEAIDREATVFYTTVDGTAQANIDYVPKSGTLHFNPREFQQTISIQVLGDVLNEAAETFRVRLTNAFEAQIAKGEAIGTILNDDRQPVLSIDSPSGLEGNGPGSLAVFRVSIPDVSGVPVVVNYAPVSGTAVIGQDFENQPGPVTIPAGESSATFSIALVGDAIDEPDEVFFVNLSASENATLAVTQTQFTILDDDDPPRLLIPEKLVIEGNSGVAAVLVDVQLSLPSGKLISVDYSTGDGTAKAPGDYRTTSNPLEFEPGTTNRTVSVEIVSDLLRESDEVFFLNLENATNAEIPLNPGRITIVNDDTTPGLLIADISVAEGDTGIAEAFFNITLTAAAEQIVSFDFATEAGTATALSDFFPASARVILLPGEITATVTILINSDRLREPDETFFLKLSNLRNAVFIENRDRAQATIRNDDPFPLLSISAPAVLEGNADFINAIVAVSLSQASGEAVNVDYSTEDGTAAEGADYSPANGSITFAPGDLQKNFTVRILGDTLDENDEMVRVILSEAQNATLQTNQTQLIILDDDPLPEISINDVQANENAGSMTFAVILSAASGRDVSVRYATSNGTAEAGQDYTAKQGSVTFAPEETSKTIAIDIEDNLIPEPEETLIVGLFDPRNSKLSRTAGIGTILDDELFPLVFVEDASVQEGSGTVSRLIFPVRLSQASAQPISVSFATANESAEAGNDYVAKAGTLSLSPGQTTATIEVAVLGDFLNEPDETLVLKLSNPVNVSLSREVVLGIIRNDDPEPLLSVSDFTVIEGNESAFQILVPVNLSHPSGYSITVGFAAADDTAQAGIDYIVTPGTLVFEPGQTTQSIVVLVLSDTIRESDETFTLSLVGPAHAGIEKGVARGTIVNDDDAPLLSIDDLEIAEGSSGVIAAVFTVRLSHESALAVTVKFNTVDGTAKGNEDYVPKEEIVTFPPGETSRVVSVGIIGDSISEPVERFVVELSEPRNALILRSRAEAVIIDDDPLPILTIGDILVPEGNAGLTEARFSAFLSAPSGRTVSVMYASTNGTAVAGSDYIGGGGVLVFEPGITSRTVPFFVFGDTLHELDETFHINLFNLSNAVLAAPRIQGTIVNDDPAPAISIGDAEVIEGNTGNFTLVVPAGLSAAAGVVITVNFALEDGSATAGNDYEANSGTVTFQPGQTIAPIPLIIHGNTRAEPDKTFKILLSSPMNATLAKETATVRIINDDRLPSLTIADASVMEGNTGTTNAVFRVTLSEPALEPVSVIYSTSDGTATAGSDYDTVTERTLTLDPGQTSGLILIPVRGDTVAESDEVFFVNLGAAVNATLRDSQAVGTIADDDAPIGISVSDAAVTEGNAGTASLDFTVALSASSANRITIKYGTVDGTARAPADYEAIAGTLTFEPGATIQILTVKVRGDRFDEEDETLILQLSEPAGGLLLDGEGIGTITNDDRAPAIQADDATFVEGASIAFAVRLSAPSGRIVSVRYSTQDGTASSPADYTSVAGTLIFEPGVTSRTISILSADDSVSEPDETFTIRFSDPNNGSIGRSSATVTIRDNDAIPSISMADVTVQETDSGIKNAVIPVRLSAPSARTVSVSFSTMAGTATRDVDYTHTSGVLIFPAGVTALTISVEVIGDMLHESTETFSVKLSSATGATIAKDTGTTTILDNDVESMISISDASLVEGNSGTNQMNFTIRLSEAAAQLVSVHFATFPGTATEKTDYIARSGTASFPPGILTNLVAVDIIGDLLDEPNETFELRLDSALGAQISDSLGIGTIINDDVAPSISVSDAAVVEGNSGITNAAFIVRLSIASGRTVTVDFTTENGTAVSGEDYRPASGTLTFEPGILTQTVAVSVIGDTLRENDETFLLNLRNPVNATIVDAQGLGTILDDDEAVNVPPTIRIINPLNGSALTTPAEITITADASDRDGNVQSVEFFVGSILLETRVQPPFSVIWENDAAGEYSLTAVATDNEGAQTIAEPVRLLVKRGIAASEVAIVRNFPDPEIRKIQDYLLELGLSSQVFDQEGFTFQSVNDYQLIIWDDLGALEGGLTANDVRVFREAQQNRIPLYMIGDVVASSGAALTGSSRTDWEQLTHLALRSSGTATSVIEPNQSIEHAVLQGHFGVVTGFAYPPGIASVVQPGSGVVSLARSGASDVLVAYEADNFTQTRSVTQSFLASNGTDSRSITERKRLFKNAVVWLLNRGFHALTDISLTVSGPENPVKAGEEFAYSVIIRHRGEISGTGIEFTLDLPNGVRFVRGDFIQGSLEPVDGAVIYQLGNMDNGQQTTLVLSLVPTLSGSLQLRATVSGNEPDPVLTNNTDLLEISVAPGSAPTNPPAVTLSRLGTGQIDLQVLNESRQPLRIQSSADLVKWLDVTNTTARSLLLPIGNAGDPKSTNLFYRVVSP
ncbi:MAG: Ig-like domain-containing protein, partial [Verrucomicrobia bacterium]|nr:Ig-like domain-containing protein [Verrucomicrobiota bacterium]